MPYFTRSKKVSGKGAQWVGIVLNVKAFDEALRVFNKARTNVVGCLKSAIEAFKSEELRQLHIEHRDLPLKYATADTEAGPDTALVITGFKDAEEIECFLCGKLNVSGK